MRCTPCLALLALLILGCESEPTSPGAISPQPKVERQVVFADRSKQAPFDHGRALLAQIQAAVNAGPTSSQATELGFKCANLRYDQKSLAGEEDPIVFRFLADVDKLCGLDLPFASAQVELREIDAKRRVGAGTKSECLGLKLAVGDFDPKYASNPSVAEIGGKYATLCPSE